MFASARTPPAASPYLAHCGYANSASSTTRTEAAVAATARSAGANRAIRWIAVM